MERNTVSGIDGEGYGLGSLRKNLVLYRAAFGRAPRFRGCVRPGKATAGPSTTLRSGRDDNSIAGSGISR